MKDLLGHHLAKYSFISNFDTVNPSFHSGQGSSRFVFVSRRYILSHFDTKSQRIFNFKEMNVYVRNL